MKKMTWKKRMVSAILALSMVASFLPAGLLPEAMALPSSGYLSQSASGDPNSGIKFADIDLQIDQAGNYTLTAYNAISSETARIDTAVAIVPAFHTAANSVLTKLIANDGDLNSESLNTAAMETLVRSYFDSMPGVPVMFNTAGQYYNQTALLPDGTAVTKAVQWTGKLDNCDASDAYDVLQSLYPQSTMLYDQNGVHSSRTSFPYIVLFNTGSSLTLQWASADVAVDGVFLRPNIVATYKKDGSFSTNNTEPKAGHWDNFTIEDGEIADAGMAYVYYTLTNGTGVDITLLGLLVTPQDDTVEGFDVWGEPMVIEYTEDGNLDEDKAVPLANYGILPGKQSVVVRIECSGDILIDPGPIGVGDVTLSYLSAEQGDEPVSTSATLELLSATYTWAGEDISFTTYENYDPTKPRDDDWIKSGYRWTELTFTTDGDDVEFDPTVDAEFVDVTGKMVGADIEWATDSGFTNLITGPITLTGNNVENHIYVRVKNVPKGITSPVEPDPDVGPLVRINTPGSYTVPVHMGVTAPGSAAVTVNLDGVEQSGLTVTATNGSDVQTGKWDAASKSYQFDALSNSLTYTVSVSGDSGWKKGTAATISNGKNATLDFYTITAAPGDGAATATVDGAASGVYQKGTSFKVTATAAAGYTGQATWSSAQPATGNKAGTACTAPGKTNSGAASAAVTVTGTSVLTATFGGNSVTVTVKLNGSADTTGKTVELYDGSTKVGTATANTATGVAIFTAIPGGKSYDIYVGGKTGVTIAVNDAGGSATLNYYEVKLATPINNGTVSAVYNSGTPVTAAGATIATILSNEGATNAKSIALTATPANLNYEATWSQSPAGGAFNPAAAAGVRNTTWTITNNYSDAGPIILKPSFASNGNYTGYVKVNHNGSPANQYTVKLTSKTDATQTRTGTTDATGLVSFDGLKGDYTVEVTAKGGTTAFVDTGTLTSNHDTAAKALVLSYHDVTIAIAADGSALSASVARGGRTVNNTTNPPVLTVLQGQQATLSATANYAGGYGGTVVWTPTQAAGGTQSTVSGSAVTVNKPVTVTASYPANEIKINVHRNGPIDTANAKKVDLRISDTATNALVTASAGTNGVVTFSPVTGGTGNSKVTYYIFVDGAYTNHKVECVPGGKGSHDLYYYDVHFGTPTGVGGSYAAGADTTDKEVLKDGMTTGTANRDSVGLPGLTVTNPNNYELKDWHMSPNSTGSFNGTPKTSWTVTTTSDCSGEDKPGITLWPEFQRTGYAATIQILVDGVPTNGLKVNLSPAPGTPETNDHNTAAIGGVDGKVQYSKLAAREYTVTVSSGSNTFVGQGKFTITNADRDDVVFRFYTVTAAPNADGSAATATVTNSYNVFLEGQTANFSASPNTASGYTGTATWSFVLTNPDGTQADKTGNTTSMVVNNTIAATAKYTQYLATVTTNVNGSAARTGITSVKLMTGSTAGDVVNINPSVSGAVNTYTLTVGHPAYTHVQVVTNAGTYVMALPGGGITGPTARAKTVDLYTLTTAVNPAGAGTAQIKQSTASGKTTATVPAGTVLDVTATQASGRVFQNWTLTGTGSAIASTTAMATNVTMGAAATVATANFDSVPTPVVNAAVYRDATHWGYENGYLVSLSVKSTTDVDFYYMLSTSGTAPTAAAVVAAGTAAEGNNGTVRGTHSGGTATWNKGDKLFTGLTPYTHYYVYAVAKINGVDSAVGRGEFWTDHKVTVGVTPNGADKQGKVTVTPQGGTAGAASAIDQVFSVPHGNKLGLVAAPDDATSYIFQKWTVTGGGAVGGATTAGTDYTASGTTGTVTVMASFEPIYHVVYNANGGILVGAATLPTDSKTPGYKTSETITMDTTMTAAKITKAGYTFQGWSTLPTAKSKMTSRAVSAALGDQPTVQPGGNIILYAVWTENNLDAATANMTAVYHMNATEWVSTAGARPAAFGKAITGPIDLDVAMKANTDSGKGSGSYTFTAGTGFPSYLQIVDRADGHSWIELKPDTRIGNAGNGQNFTVKVVDDVTKKETTLTVRYDVDKAIPEIKAFKYEPNTPEKINWYKNNVIARGTITATVLDEFDKGTDITTPGTWTANPTTFQEKDINTPHDYTFTFTVTGTNANNYYTADTTVDLRSQERDPNLTIDDPVVRTIVYKTVTAQETITVNLGNESSKGSRITDLKTAMTTTDTGVFGGLTQPVKTTLDKDETTTFTFTLKPDQPVGTYTMSVTASGKVGDGEQSGQNVDAVYTYKLIVVPAQLDHASVGDITAPVAGSAPVTTAPGKKSTTPDYQNMYTVSSVTWRDVSTGSTVSGNFMPGKRYSASVTLTPNANYWFVEPGQGNMNDHVDCDIGYILNGVKTSKTGAAAPSGEVSYTVNANHTVTLTYLFDRLPADGLMISLSPLSARTAQVDNIQLPGLEGSVTSVTFYYVVTDQADATLTPADIKAIALGGDRTAHHVIAGANAVGTQTVTPKDGLAEWNVNAKLNDLTPDGQYWAYAVAESDGVLTPLTSDTAHLPKALTVTVSTGYGNVQSQGTFGHFGGTPNSITVPANGTSGELSMSGNATLGAQHAPIATTAGSEHNNPTTFALKDIQVTSGEGDSAVTVPLDPLTQSYTYNQAGADPVTTVVFSFRRRLTGTPVITSTTDANGNPILTVTGGLSIGGQTVGDLTMGDLKWQWQYQKTGTSSFVNVKSWTPAGETEASTGTDLRYTVDNSDSDYAGATFRVVVTYENADDDTRDGRHSSVSADQKRNAAQLDPPEVSLDPAPDTEDKGGLHFEITELSDDDKPGLDRVKEYEVVLVDKDTGKTITKTPIKIPADGSNTPPKSLDWPLDKDSNMVEDLNPDHTYEVRVVAKTKDPNKYTDSPVATDTAKPAKKNLAPWDITWVDRIFVGNNWNPWNTRPTAVGGGAVTITATLDTTKGTKKPDGTYNPYTRTDGATITPAEQQKFAGTYNMTVAVAESSRYKALSAFDAGVWHITQATARMYLNNDKTYNISATTESHNNVAQYLVPTVTYPAEGANAQYGNGTVTGYYEYTYTLTKAPATSKHKVGTVYPDRAGLEDFVPDVDDGTPYEFTVTAKYHTDPNDPNFEVDVSEPAVRVFTVQTSERTPTAIHLYWQETDVPAADRDKIPGNISFDPKATKDVAYGDPQETYMNAAGDNNDAKLMELTHLVVRVIYDNGKSESWHKMGTNAMPAGMQWVIKNGGLVKQEPPADPDNPVPNEHIRFSGAGSTGIQVKLGTLTSPETVTYSMAKRPLDWQVVCDDEKIWNNSTAVNGEHILSNKLEGDEVDIARSGYATNDSNVGKDKPVHAVVTGNTNANTDVTGRDKAFYRRGNETTDVIDIYPAHINPMEVEIDKPSTITVNDANLMSKVGFRVKQKNDESNKGGGSITSVGVPPMKWEIWNTATAQWEEIPADPGNKFKIDSLYRVTVVLQADGNHYFRQGDEDKFYNVNGFYDGDYAYLDPEWKKDASLVTVDVDEESVIHPDLNVLHNNKVTISMVFDTSETPELRYSDGVGVGNDGTGPNGENTYHHEPNKYVTHTEDVTIGDVTSDLVYTINLDAFTKPIFGVTVAVTDNDLTGREGVTLVPTRPADAPSTSRVEMKLPGYVADGTIPGDRDYDIDKDRISYTLTIPQALANTKGTYTLTLQARGASSQANVEAGRYDVADNRYTFVLVVREKQKDPPPPVSGGGGTTVVETPVVKYWVSDYGYTDDLTAEKLSKKGAKPSFVPKITALPGLKFLGWAETDPAKSKDGKLPTLVDPLTFSISEDKIFYAVYERMEVSHSHYVIGFPDGTFGPDHHITRGQVATIIARACLEDFIEGGSYGNPGNYTDVEGHWANSAIAYCSMKGVFTGYTDGTFRPDRYISRQELATVVARLAGVQVNEGLPFSDNGEISSWALNGVYTNYVNGWVNGYTDGTFKPLNNITRAETVKIFNGYLNRGVDKEGLSELREYVHQGVASNNTGNGTDEYMTWPDVAKTHWAYYEIIEAANDHNFRWRDATKATPPEEWYEAFIDEVWRYDDNAEDGADDVGRDNTLPILTVTYVVKSNGVVWESLTEEVTKFASPSVEKLPKAQASEGYYFMGWSETDPDEGEISLIDPTAHSVLEDRTFYAVFGKIPTGEPEPSEAPAPTESAGPDEPIGPEPTDSPEPTEPVESPVTEPTDSPEPTEPVEPPVTEPTDSPEPTEPVEPPVTEPTDSPEPTEPVEPPVTEPTDSPEPTEPVEPPVTEPTDSPEPTEPVEYARTRYINGYTDGTFRPDDAFTRAAVATVIANLMGYDPEVTYLDAGFDDLSDHWGANAIHYCVEAGLLSGYTDNTFRPDNAISRQEFAIVLTRLAKETDVEPEELPFTDVEDIAPWAVENVALAYAMGWIGGYDDGTFLPGRNVSRAEAVKMFNAYLGRSADPESIEGQSGYTLWADVPTTHWAYYEIIEASNNWVE